MARWRLSTRGTEVILFDFFSPYFREIKVSPVIIEGLDPIVRKRGNISLLQLFLVYLMKLAGSIPRVDPGEDFLLTGDLLTELCLFGKRKGLRGVSDMAQNADSQ
jgi:hypothetical protein